MSLGPRLDLRTAQTLVLSPQLQAAIRLLALSNIELESEIRIELEKNPLLELADDGSGADAPASDGHDGHDGAAAPAAAGEAELPDGLAADREQATDADLVAERFHHDCPADSAGGEAPPELDDYARSEESLHQALERQAVARLSGTTLALVLAIVASLDEAGYLTEPLEELAERLGVALGDAEAALARVQGFEPTGVGARSLGECIALQAREADRLDPAMAVLLSRLDLVARGDFAQLRRLCEVDQDDLSDMLRELRGYDPKPGHVLGGHAAQTVMPDVFVRRTQGGWAVELNSGTLPRLVINRQYQAELKTGAVRDPRTARARRQFVDGAAAQAQWLVKALDQRANTIVKVATEIVRHQQGFFEHGVHELRPLTLRTIAEAIDMHESTVSRVTSNKYLHCSRGVFELKYFFSGGIHSADGGEDASAVAVRACLQALVEAEDPLKPVSDDRLVELLRGEGHDLARRTVAKYRDTLGIPSSFDRRRRARLASA